MQFEFNVIEASYLFLIDKYFRSFHFNDFTTSSMSVHSTMATLPVPWSPLEGAVSWPSLTTTGIPWRLSRLTRARNAGPCTIWRLMSCRSCTGTPCWRKGGNWIWISQFQGYILDLWPMVVLILCVIRYCFSMKISFLELNFKTKSMNSDI